MDKSNVNIYLARKNKENTLVFFPMPRAMAILALGLYSPLLSSDETSSFNDPVKSIILLM